MADEVTNNPSVTDSPESMVSEGMKAFTMPSQTDEQSVDNAPAGEPQGQEVTPDQKFWGKFNSEDEAKKSYEEAQAALTRANQQLAEMKKQPVQSQATVQAQPVQEQKFLDLQFGNQPVAQQDLYPGTEQMLGSAVDKRLGQFATQISGQLNPVLAQMTKQLNELQGKLVVADSRNVAATIAEDFPELKTDKEFRADVEQTMKDMQQGLQVNLKDSRQFDTLLRNACYAIRGKRGYSKGQAIQAENKAAGQVGMRGMATGQGKEHGVEKSEADVIRDGILSVAQSERSNSIF